MKKELKIRDFCGDYALDIPDYNGSNFTLYFNSKRNAENVKRIIEIDGSKPNEATVCDMQEIKHAKWVISKFADDFYCCTGCGSSWNRTFDFCPSCGAKMDKE